ncbi:protein GVQW3 [Trichonephila clavipes]|nr:protein GVQW3 [Trichonephila clavipes]
MQDLKYRRAIMQRSRKKDRNNNEIMGQKNFYLKVVLQQVLEITTRSRLSLVYADKPQTLDHLEDNIRRAIADIRPQMLEKVIENWTSRLDYIRASRGSPMPEILFKIECLSRARVFEWFKRFKDGRQDVEDDSRPGRPSTSKTDENVEKVASLIRSDRRLSICAIAETVNIDKECVRQILLDNLNM